MVHVALGAKGRAVEEQSHEQATYLWVAETVLRRHRRPLTARQLVTYGIEDGLFADMDLSRTPQKSMQARLSTDILSRGDASRFVRTDRGKFFLREILAEQTSEGLGGGLKVYTAERRVPTPPSEHVLVIPRKSYSTILDFQGIRSDYEFVLNRMLGTSALRYMPRTEAEVNSDYKQFVTYTIIQQKNRVLSFRRGHYNRAASFLRGARCIGFGGHVTEDDLTIFSVADRGIRENAAREIAEEIRLASGARPQVNHNDIEVLGFLNDDSSDVGVRHVAAVMRYWAPETLDWKNPQRGEASIAQLRWMKTVGTEIDLPEFEYWSQLVLRTYYPGFLTNRPSYKLVRPGVFQQPHLLCVAGSVGSGKSITTSRLCSRAGYHQINTGRVVADILGLPPVPTTPRAEFQQCAFEMITQPDGPRRLAAAILDQVSRSVEPRIIIDGIRQLETLERLKEAAPRPVATLFVHTPPDVAYKFYVLREAKNPNISISDFMSIYNAPVEAQVPLLLSEADAVIYNWFGLEEHELVIDRLLADLGLLQDG